MNQLYARLAGPLLFLLFFTYSHAQSFSETAILESDIPVNGGFHGHSVGIAGELTIVGATGDNLDDFGANPLNQAGAVYIYGPNLGQPWNLIQKIVGWDRDPYEHFGHSVAISGNYAIVGAWGDDDDELGGNQVFLSGSAYLLERQTSGWWDIVQKIAAPDRAQGDRFGEKVAIYGDYAVIGAPYKTITVAGDQKTNAGAAYIYERDSTGKWEFIKRLTAFTPDNEDRFGEALSIWKGQLVVGAPGDDDTVGSNPRPDAGAVYYFDRDQNGEWEYVQTILEISRGMDNFFGEAIAIQEDQLVIGVPGDDTFDGPNLMTNSGSAHLYKIDSTGNFAFSQFLIPSDWSPNDRVGKSVAIDGNRILVGAFFESTDSNGGNYMARSGAVYVFEPDSVNGWILSQKLAASNRQTGAQFGFSSAIYGNNIVVGANEHDYAGNGFEPVAGAAYVFESCSDETTYHNATSCGDYTWNGTTYSSSGTYTITRPSVTGCDTIETLLLTIPSIDAGVSVQPPMFHSIVSNATYQWVDCNNGFSPIQGATNQSFEPNSPGNYAVIVLKNACRDTSDCYPTTLLGRESRGTELHAEIFPNPSSDDFHIDLHGNLSSVQVQLLGINGRVLFSKTYKAVSSITINPEIPSGLYFLSITTSNGQTARLKLIRE